MNERDFWAGVRAKMAADRKPENQARANADAVILRSAARIIRERSTRKRSLTLDVFCKVLTDTADKIEREAAA